MPKPDHREHDHKVVTEDYRLKNVAYTETHDLIRCKDDQFFGWVERKTA